MCKDNEQKKDLQFIFAAIDSIDHIFVVNDARNISPEEMKAIHEILCLNEKVNATF